MVRADSARRKTSDDIPLARRSGQLKKPGLRGLLLASTLIALLLTFLVIPFLDGSGRLLGPQSGPSVDGRLLGHYPYEEVPRSSLVEVYPGLEIHKDTYKALSSMRSAAASAGVELILLSGFRSIDLQRDIFYGRKSARNQIAIERAKVSAPPGYSEHSTGYAIDLGDGKRRDTDLEVQFEETDSFKWLQRNAAKYHFVMSFPRGNSQKVSYEPWHWRFEGTVEALRQFENANEIRRTQTSTN